MPRARLFVVALFALLALPGPASAAEPVDVSGIVRNADGTPAAAVEVLVGVAGSDVVQPATTDQDGAFALQVEAQAGDTIEVRATGTTVRTGPDEDGCVHSSTPTGKASVTIETLPLDPIVVVLDTVIEDTICTTTKPPVPPPAPTPPATDAGGSPARSGGDAGWLTVLTVLATVSLVALRISPRPGARQARG